MNRAPSGDGTGTAGVLPAAAPSPIAFDRIGRVLGTGVIPFTLVFYLGLQGGGYDAIVRGQIGVVVWWLVLLGALSGILPVRRITTTGWIACGAFAFLLLWTALSLGWSDSAERTMNEVARVATLGGVFVLSLLSQGRDGLRRSMAAVATAITLIGLIALLSRLQPGWIPNTEDLGQTATARIRLNYPLDYWNGLADLIAIGLPPLVAFAMQSKAISWRALAAAAIPALALTAYFTLSRGGAISALTGLVVLIALWPRRMAGLPVLFAAGTGSAILIAAAAQRDALGNGLSNATALSQGTEMFWMTVVVSMATGLVVAAIALVGEYRLIKGLNPPSIRTTLIAWAAVLGILLVGAFASDLPGEASDAWSSFKEPGVPGTTTAGRLTSASGSNRYQFWQAATDANATDPLKGIGAGSYEYWWAANGSVATFIRDAHSLYLETLAELGVIGLAALLTLIGTLFWHGAKLTGGGDERTRSHASAALAAIVAFLVGAAADWSWEMTVLPVAFLIVAAALVAKRRGRRKPPSRGLGQRIGFSAAAVLGLLAIAPPLGAATALHESQQAAEAGDLTGALAYAQNAADLQPYAASPKLQQALVLELQGDLPAAADAAASATDKEPTNWRTWQVRSRIAAERREVADSIRFYRTARELNPRSPLFTTPESTDEST